MKLEDLTETQIDLFEAYATHKLHDEEKKNFEQSLAQDQELRKSYQIYLLSLEVIDLKIAESLKANMNKWKANAQDSEPTAKVIPINSKVSFTKYIKWAAAACVLAVVATTGIKDYKFNHFPDQEIQRLLTLGDFNVRGTNEKDPLQQAYHSYTTSGYDLEVYIKEIQAISSTDSVYQAAQIELGKIYIKKGNCPEAKTAFENGKDRENNVASIGLVLCHVKCNKLDREFQSAIQGILNNPTHPDYADAVKINNTINSFWWKLLH